MFLFCTVTQAPEISFDSKECERMPENKSHFFISLTLKTLVMIILFGVERKSSLQLARSPDVISTSPKSFLMSRIDFTVLLLFQFLKKHHLPVG